MLDFYQNGSEISLTLQGLGGFLLLTYFVLEMIILFFTQSLFIHKILIYITLSRQIKKSIPNWWKLSKINIVTIQKTSSGFEVYVNIKNKINDDWINEKITIDWIGRIKCDKIKKSIEKVDNRIRLEIKEWNRNKILQDIGL